MSEFEEPTGLETLAPQVVAVVVTCDPGPAFEETLCSLRDQDYGELSVLVIDAASAEDPTDRVASVIPGAYVRTLEKNYGFAASCNEAMSMVEGSSYFLFCHDDVALDPDALHLLVEESFRSNAGIVSPKFVSWDDPRRLLHVGMMTDKSGAVVDRVLAGEIDQGQHDAVRDIFFAPGGCTLVRTDLFVELGGFDPSIFAMGEDLDLCWRAQIAGARVVVEPSARVRHLEQLASGRKALPPEAMAPSLAALQRRHELRVVLKCYGRRHLLRVLPQLVLLSIAEMVIAWATGHKDRATALVHGLRWNASRWRDIEEQRKLVRKTRRVSDRQVRRLQVGGSARSAAYVRRAITYGLHVAHLGGIEEELAVGQTDDQPGPPERFKLSYRRGESVSFRMILWIVAIALLLYGSRQLIESGIPVIGQFLDLPSWSQMLERVVSGWQPTGLGSAGPTSPALGVLGFLSMILGGSNGMVRTLLILGCLPVGTIGMTRLTRPIGGPRVRTVAAVLYVGIPLPYDALATGKLDTLVCYAAVPWILARIARNTGAEPFASVSEVSFARTVCALSLIQAVATSVAPQASTFTLVIAISVAAGQLLFGGLKQWRRAFSVAASGVAATIGSFALLAPWSVSVLAGQDRWSILFGPRTTGGAASSLGALLRLSPGPIGNTPVCYAFIVAAALPVVIGGSWRLSWAGRMWILALVGWVLSWASAHGWTGIFSFSPVDLLTLVGTAIAIAGGLGAEAFEKDLASYRFGWRQGAPFLAAAAIVVGLFPVLIGTFGGRWGIAPLGYDQALSWVPTNAVNLPVTGPEVAGEYRVLFLGGPQVLPGGGSPSQDGVNYVLSNTSVPDASDLWPSSSQGPAASVANAVDLATEGKTVLLGHLLAAYSVRYIVVVNELAPNFPGYSQPLSGSTPGSLANALNEQSDLEAVPGTDGYQVYIDNYSVPERSVTEAAVGNQPAKRIAVLSGTPGSSSYSGKVPSGELEMVAAPSDKWRLAGPDGILLPRKEISQEKAGFIVQSPETVTLNYVGSWTTFLAVMLEFFVWIALLIGLIRGPKVRPALESVPDPGLLEAEEDEAESRLEGSSSTSDTDFDGEPSKRGMPDSSDLIEQRATFDAEEDRASSVDDASDGDRTGMPQGTEEEVIEVPDVGDLTFDLIDPSESS